MLSPKSARMRNARVLVIGGTGLVGTPTVGLLAERGFQPVVLTRSAAKGAELRRRSFEVAVGEVTDLRSLVDAAEGCGAIIHSVGLLLEKGEMTYERVNLGGMLNTIAAARAAGVRRVLHVGVVGLGEGEETAATERNPYAASKIRAETALRDSGLDWTVVRCSYIYGSEAPVIGLMRKLVRLPVVPVIGSGTQHLQFVAAEDVAATLVAALERDETVRRVYELGGAESLTYDEVVDAVAASVGRRRKPKLHLPVSWIRPLLPLIARVPGSVLTPTTMDMLLRESVCDSGPVRRELGVEPRSLSDGLRAQGGEASFG